MSYTFLKLPHIPLQSSVYNSSSVRGGREGGHVCTRRPDKKAKGMIHVSEFSSVHNRQFVYHSHSLHVFDATIWPYTQKHATTHHPKPCWKGYIPCGAIHSYAQNGQECGLGSLMLWWTTEPGKCNCLRRPADVQMTTCLQNYNVVRNTTDVTWTTVPLEYTDTAGKGYTTVTEVQRNAVMPLKRVTQRPQHRRLLWETAGRWTIKTAGAAGGNSKPLVNHRPGIMVRLSLWDDHDTASCCLRDKQVVSFLLFSFR